MRCVDSPEENLGRAIAGVEEAARLGARIVCLQELFTTRYFCVREDPARFDLAESVPGPTTKELGRCASELGVVIIGSLFERRAEGIYHNTAVVIAAKAKTAHGKVVRSMRR